MKLLDRYFRLAERGTSVRTEVIGGITTFAATAYIIVANPAILAAVPLPVGPSTVATILVAVFGCLLMGRWGGNSRRICWMPRAGSTCFRLPMPDFCITSRCQHCVI